MKKLKIATLLAVPIALGAYVNSVASWRPRTLAQYRAPVLSVSWSPDGKRLASAGGDGNVSVWDASSMKLERVLSEQPRKATQVAFSPDGEWIAASFSGTSGKPDHYPAMEEEDGAGKACVWDANNGELKRSYHAWHGMTSLAWTHDSKALATSAESEVDLWDLEEILKRDGVSVGSGQKSWLKALALAPDGSSAVGLSEAGTAYWMKLHSSQAQSRADRKSSPKRLSTGTSAAFSPDSKMFVVSSRTWTDFSDSQLIFYYGQAREQHVTLDAQCAHVSALAFSPDGETLAGAATDGHINLWDVASRKLLRTLSASTRGITSLAFTPDSNTLASSSDDGTVRLWRVR